MFTDLSGQEFPLLLLFRGDVMESKLAVIKKAIEPPLTELEIIIDSIEYEKEGTCYFLRIVLDQISGIDLDKIVEATNIINPILDELDIIDDSYVLDVLSKERG